MHQLIYTSLITLYSCNRTVGCIRTPVIGQLKQPIMLSPLSKIHQSNNRSHNQTSNDHLPWKKTWKFPNLKKMFVLNVFLFRNLQWLWLIGNRNSCRPIRSVIIRVIDKSGSCFAVVRFCYWKYSYDCTPNWTPLGPITIINWSSRPGRATGHIQTLPNYPLPLSWNNLNCCCLQIVWTCNRQLLMFNQFISVNWGCIS